jgi:CRP-like cAMP-binding protein
MDEPAAARAASAADRGSVFSAPGLDDPTAWMTPPNVRPLGAAEAPGLPGGPLVPRMAASPRLSRALFARLTGYGTPQQTREGDVLFEPGDVDVDLIVVAEGSVEVIRAATAAVPAETVAKVGAGGFVGELNLLTGQNVYLRCRNGLPGLPRAAAAADGERRRAVRRRLQGAGRPP